MGTNQEGLTRLMRKRSDIFELLVQSIANWNELFNLISVRMCLSDSVNVCLCVYYSVGVYCGAVVGQMMNYSVKLSFFWCNLLKPVCPFNWLMLYEMSGHLYIVFFGMGIWGGEVLSDGNVHHGQTQNVNWFCLLQNPATELSMLSH